MFDRRWRTVAALAGCALTVGAFVSSVGGAGADTVARPLEILLTNDDGVNGGYINVIRDELCAAGHRVTIVAPSGDQSGHSSRFTTARDAKLQVTSTSFPCGSTTGQQYSIASTWTARTGTGGTYAYDGPASPVDAVRFALGVVFAGGAPDVVISGANPGQNLSSVVLKSGTVGAALAAADKGVPAIALSVAFNPADNPQAGFPAAASAARSLGRWTVRLLDKLQSNSRRGEAILPEGVSLNVNYPTPLNPDGTFAANAVGDAVLTVAGERDLIPIAYQATGVPGEYRVSVSLCGLSSAPQCGAPEVKDADTTAVERNQISVQPMDGDVTVTPPARSGMKAVLNELNK